MARRTTAARRYAEAAFELGRADGSLDAWERDLAPTGARPSPAPSSQPASSIPRSRSRSKERILRRVVGDGVAAAPLNLVLLMIRRGRPGRSTAWSNASTSSLRATAASR